MQLTVLNDDVKMNYRIKDTHVVIQDFTFIVLSKAWWWPFSAGTSGLLLTECFYSINMALLDVWSY
jgi:hypothetical protein